MGYFLAGLFFSLLTVLSLSLMFFFNTKCCKHLVYLNCFFLLLMFILYFIGALLVGVLTPASYVACEGVSSFMGNSSAI